MGIISGAVSYLMSHVISILSSLIKGGIVFVIGWKLAKWITNLIKKSKTFQKLDDGIESFVASLIEILLKAID